MRGGAGKVSSVLGPGTWGLGREPGQKGLSEGDTLSPLPPSPSSDQPNRAAREMKGLLREGVYQGYSSSVEPRAATSTDTHTHT